MIGPAVGLAATLGLAAVLLSPLVALVLVARHAWTHTTLSRDRLSAHVRVEHARASQAPVPHTLTIGGRAGPIGKEGPTATTTALPAIVAPTMAEVLGVGEGPTIRLGTDAETGEPVSGTWDDIHSAGINGISGSGKTNSAAWIAAQGALIGVRLLVVDPHATKDDSLARRLAPLASAYLDTPGVDAEGTDRVIGTALDVLEQRKAGAPDRTRVLLVVDEWTSVMRRSKDQARNLAAIASEGRNYGVFALLLAQCWTSAAVGGTEMRDTLASCFVHRSRNRDALMASGLPAAAIGKTMDLPRGQCLFISTSGDLRTLMVPRITPGEMQVVGDRLAAAA